MDPLKAAAATAVCLVLFWLAFRLTRRLVDMAIAGGYAEERRRLAEEEAQAAAGAEPHAAANGGSTMGLAGNGDPSTTSAIGIVQGASAK